ncbi:hypothetical protein DdX_21056 [Ditylenchus destructor]|uniref:Uncharacterized protein n=1 Tax=Ditylenchus destructor TaxID=166010 RepID=A0AAD4MJQ5_9BILA|nr:hypothetical protein DdX_21056 [Ditylenchus destructor]
MRRFDGIADAPAEPQHIACPAAIVEITLGAGRRLRLDPARRDDHRPDCAGDAAPHPARPGITSPVAERVAKADPRADSPQAPGPARPAKPPAATRTLLPHPRRVGQALRPRGRHGHGQQRNRAT